MYQMAMYNPEVPQQMQYAHAHNYGMQHLHQQPVHQEVPGTPFQHHGTTTMMSMNEQPEVVSGSPQLHSYNILHQTVTPSKVDESAIYSCNFVGQLRGSYEIDTPSGVDQVNVFVPNGGVPDDTNQYAIVRRVCSDGEALPDQLIYEDGVGFTLCAMDGSILALMMKGMNMKHSITWEDANDRSGIIWRRKGATFNLVSADSLTRKNSNSTVASRRGSISSIYSASSVMSNSVESSTLGIRPELLRPELLQQRQSFIAQRPVMMCPPTVGSYASDDSVHPCYNSTPGYSRMAAAKKQRDKSEPMMFEQIKAYCIANPSLMSKVVQWGNSKTPTTRINMDDVKNLSEGRLWVTVHPVQPSGNNEGDDNLQESLDDLKGAYQQVQSGLYLQPEPQPTEPGVQHRLMKGPRGYWKIEERDVERGSWVLSAQQMPNRLWVDVKNDRRLIRVQLVKMETILERLSEGTVVGNQEVENSMTFLFNSCNQKKLNTKLKGRNLKHNIANLKVKLEKQYKLSFAVQVANTADAIAQEEQAMAHLMSRVK